MSDTDRPPSGWELQRRLDALDSRATRLESDLKATRDALQGDIDERVHKSDFAPIQRGFWGVIAFLFVSAGTALAALIGLRVPR